MHSFMRFEGRYSRTIEAYAGLYNIIDIQCGPLILTSKAAMLDLHSYPNFSPPGLFGTHLTACKVG
jgi:hypothetical protein